MTRGATETPGADQRPNIVFILADNVGWGDLGCYGGSVPTPCLDAMAANGMRMLNYTVEAQCTPSRSALITGRHPIRSGTATIPLPGKGEYGLSPWEYTLADMLSDSGYRTAMYGKWHLGEVDGRLPTDRGFDEWWGIKNTSDEAGYASFGLFNESGMQAPQVWESRRGSPAHPVAPFDLQMRAVLDEQITERAVRFIKQAAREKEPFFLYVCLTNLHPPCLPNPRFLGVSGGNARADTLHELDYRVGQIRDALNASGRSGDTIVVFSSDNAALQISAEQGGSNGPWRGNFFTPPFEGSYRVPAIAEWPGRIPKGSTTNEMFAIVDWYTTLAALARVDNRIPLDRPIDGVDSSDHLLGKSPTSARFSVVFHGPDGLPMSVKWKTIKVIFRYSRGASEPIVQPQFPLIYDLASDPAEQWNLLETRCDCLWMYGPALKELHAFAASTGKYRNVEPGEDFVGYK